MDRSWEEIFSFLSSNPLSLFNMSEMDEKIHTEANKAEVEEHHDTAVEHTEDSAFGPAPTDEDWKALREVADTIPKSAFLVILIEFCERFTYYGLSGPFQNYIQNPAPDSCKYNLIISQLSSLSYSYSLLFPTRSRCSTWCSWPRSANRYCSLHFLSILVLYYSHSRSYHCWSVSWKVPNYSRVRKHLLYWFNYYHRHIHSIRHRKWSRIPWFCCWYYHCRTWHWWYQVQCVPTCCWTIQVQQAIHQDFEIWWTCHCHSSSNVCI